MIVELVAGLGAVFLLGVIAGIWLRGRYIK